MTEALSHRAQEVLEMYPFPSRPRDEQVTLFIAGHGTGNNQNSRRIIEQQAAQLRATGRYADVHAVFMEEEPRIEACYEMAQSRNIVMVPFFISDGLHSFEDIPMMLGESATVVEKRLKEGVPTWRNPTERQGKRVWYTRSIGLDAAISDVVLERAQEAAAWSGEERVSIDSRGRKRA